jgi:hypothetical protein
MTDFELKVYYQDYTKSIPDDYFLIRNQLHLKNIVILQAKRLFIYLYINLKLLTIY